MNREVRARILEDEVLIVRHSGEIPEITYHATVHYLCSDPSGPGMTLAREELLILQDAALARAREIVLRDLDPDNRDLSIYRGLKRTIYNWQRLLAFAERLNRSEKDFREKVRQALRIFLESEWLDVTSGRRTSSVNCTAKELAGFAAALGVTTDELPEGWQALCLEEEP